MSRAHARAADLRRLGAGAEAAAGRRTSSGRCTDLVPAPDPVFIERVYPRRGRGRRPGATCGRPRRRETCTEMARLALDDALIELEERYGARLESWRWGDAHQALHLHQTLGQRAGAEASRQHPPEHAGRRPHAPARADAGDGRRALPQRARRGVPRGLRLLRSGLERLRHRDRRERASAVAPLRRSGGDLAALGVYPDVARPGPGARRRGRGDAAAPAAGEAAGRRPDAPALSG